MISMGWVKGAVVAVGLSLGGSALAAGPRPVYVEYRSAEVYEHHRDGNFDGGGWNDRWLDDHDGFDRHDRRVFRIARQKIADGRALQARGEILLERARYARSYRLARQGQRLIQRGEWLERQGRMLIRSVRS